MDSSATPSDLLPSQMALTCPNTTPPPVPPPSRPSTPREPRQLVPLFDDSCTDALNGVCDETTCPPGTDYSDCSSMGYGDDSCQYAMNGVCDEPTLCSPGTDYSDCSAGSGNLIELDGAIRLAACRAGDGCCRVEVFNAGEWGTVCDDGWDDADANVVCASFGCSGGTGVQNFGGGTGRIWLDDVACSGSEASLAACPHNEWGSHDCVHSEDAGACCAGIDLETQSCCTNDDAWADSFGDECYAYVYNPDWCHDAGYYADSNGVDATTACCVCGGGTSAAGSDAGQPPNSWTEIPLPEVPRRYNGQLYMEPVSFRQYHRVTAARGLVYVFGGSGRGEAPRPHPTCLQDLRACLTQCRCDAETTCSKSTPAPATPPYLMRPLE